MKMKISYLVTLPIIFGLTSTVSSMYLGCRTLKDLGGEISKNVDSPQSWDECWILDVPKDAYLRLNFKQSTKYFGRECSATYMNVTIEEKKELHVFCFPQGESSNSLKAEGKTEIKYHSTPDQNVGFGTKFTLTYHIEDLVCTEGNSFRCSKHSCIHQRKVCDGIKDCDNGNDELSCVTAVEGVSESKENAVSWLMEQRSSSYSWDKITHRAVTALYLAGEASFHGEDLEEELVAKQVELEIALALLRNSTDPLSVSELSMFVDALTVTCHEPRQFYGENLLKILAERVSNLKSPSPRAYLTLCISNWPLTESDIENLLTLLEKQSKYPFLLDVQAVTVMALTCAKNRMKEFKTNSNALQIYNQAIEKIITRQHPDGSFGNVYTTALVTQALMASNQLEAVQRWNVKSTTEYLINQLDSSQDFLSVYLTIPIFSGKSLADLQAVNCSTSFRKRNRDDIDDIMTTIGARKRIQFSLYVGDRKDIIHTLYVKMPENSTAYDVMRVAGALDSKYKFHHKDVAGYMYVYEVAGITNDPEAEQFWLLYTGDNNIDGEVEHHFESPDQFYLGDSEHLILWYKTAFI